MVETEKKYHPGGNAEGADQEELHPLSPSNWEERLRHARAKRAKALSQKTSEPAGIATIQTASNVDESKSIGAIAALPGLLSAWLAAHSGFAAKAAFIFLAALGFGLGSGAGLGIVSGNSWVPASQPAEASVQASQPIQIQTFDLPLDEDKVSDIPIVGVKVAQADLWMDSSKLETVLSARAVPVDAAFNLPKISKVVYTRADLDPAEASELRRIQQFLPAQQQQDSFVLAAAVDQVYLHVPSGIPNSRIAAFVDALDQNGVKVGKVGREGFRISRTHLRYYSPETKDAAETLASDLGIDARDFSATTRQTDRVELWLAGGPRQTVSVEAAPSESFFARLLGRRDSGSANN